jgi:hypothetical protein
MNTSQAKHVETTQERALPSGRSVVVRVNGGSEELEVRSAEGDVEVRITLTDSGPVVSLKGARLELESPDAVAVRCRRLDIETEEATRLASAGETHILSEDDIHMKGKIIRLN